jgi:aquaporin Z
MLRALTLHFPNYLIEAALLGLFMVSACGTVAIVAHPASPTAHRIRRPITRRAIIGLAMGLTAVILITSPFGRRSGAHLNPATTLAFLSLGKIQPWDALFYILAQFVGGIAGVAVARAGMNRVVTHSSVNCVVTAPPATTPRANRIAWLAEFGIAFLLFAAVLVTSNHAAAAPFTPFIVGALVALFITFEAPLSGMSMNPARTFASAVHARDGRALWVYFTAPPLAMLTAAWLYTASPLGGAVYCAKLDHRGDHPCIFNCRIQELRSAPPEPRP